MQYKLLLAGFLIFPGINIRDVHRLCNPKSEKANTVFAFAGFNYHKKTSGTTYIPFWETGKQKNTVTDTASLKQSNWYAEAMKGIEEREYEINYQEQSKSYSSPNRQQNLRAFYSNDKFTLAPRNDSSDKWKLTLQLKGIYAGKDKIYGPAKDPVITQSGNDIRFNNDGHFITEYVNNKEGVRQNFIIDRQPAGKPQQLIVQLEANKGWAINRVDKKEIHFAKATRNGYCKKLTYNGLKAWDANDKELDAFFSVANNEISINVNTIDAVYPITIDPLSSSPATTLNGTSSNDYFGISVASAGDVNGDGYSDVVVGAYGVSSNTGKAYLYFGSATGLSNSPATTLNGVSNGDRFGYCVASAGDVNGDGYSDVIVGAYAASSLTGKAYIFLGSGGGLNAVAATILVGPVAGENFGFSVASAGDVNGDGYSDVIVGAQVAPPSSTGTVYLFLGSAGGIPTLASEILIGILSSSFGNSVASAGDINGDGFSDIIVGAPNETTNQGWAYVYLSNGTNFPLSPSYSLHGVSSNDYFGICVSSDGDVNGDGYSDLIVGAPGVTSNTGAAYLYLGGSGSLTASTILNGVSTSDQFGATVACVGDINADGYSDVVVGAPGRSTATGAFYIFQGSSTGIASSPNITRNGFSTSSAFGYVACAGDVNGDGFSDIISGAPNTSTNTGAAYLYTGSADGISATTSTTMSGISNNDDFGISVASAGDVNGDGYSDVIIGAYGVSSQKGAAYLYLGSNIGLPIFPSTTLLDPNNTNNDAFGISVASAGDVNGDGYSDVIVGAWGVSSYKGAAYLYLGSSIGLPIFPSITLLDPNNTNNDAFGIIVASAGDVNGDGYSDVIVGAPGVSSNKGAVYLYLGSGTGLPTIPSTTLTDPNINNLDDFGYSVASAGDVNGDGYSDVIVGAYGVSSSKGAVYLYLGSVVGIPTIPSTTLTDPTNTNNDYFGWSVACAADVNGDGYSDIMVGAYQVSSNKGAAYLYLGSGTGLPTNPSTTLTDPNNTISDDFGYSVASAGDVNGDGYSDVMVGALGVSSFKGAAYLYLGSNIGLPIFPSTTLLDPNNTNNDAFGIIVASAGDVNGDGYSDVIVGAYGVSSLKGAAYFYYGDSTNNKRNNLRLYNTDLVTPIQQSNYSVPNLFGAGLYAKSPLGRVKGRLVWEVKRQGLPFSGNPITNSTAYYDKVTIFSDLGISGIELKSQVQKRGRQTKIRVRVEYSKVTAITGQVYGPWRYTPGYMQGAYGMNSIPLPLTLVAFNGQFINDDVQLQWVTANELNMQSFVVERSMDGLNFTAAGEVTAKGSGSNRAEYSLTDKNVKNNLLYYRLKIKEQSGDISYSKTITLNRNKIVKGFIAPDPVLQGGVATLTLRSAADKNAISINIFNTQGQLMSTENKILESGKNEIVLSTKELARGIYMVSVAGDGLKESYRIVVQ